MTVALIIAAIVYLLIGAGIASVSQWTLPYQTKPSAVWWLIYFVGWGPIFAMEGCRFAAWWVREKL